MKNNVAIIRSNSSRLDLAIAEAYGVDRIVGYSPGGPGRRANYSEGWLVPDYILQKARLEAAQLGIRPEGGSLMSIPRRGWRQRWCYNADKSWQSVGEELKRREDDGVVSFVGEIVYSLHGITVRPGVGSNGSSFWLCEMEGQRPYHAVRWRSQMPKEAAREAIRAWRKQEHAVRKARRRLSKHSNLSNRWITRESLKNSGACEPGIRNGAKQVARLIGIPYEQLIQKVTAVRADVVAAAGYQRWASIASLGSDVS